MNKVIERYSYSEQFKLKIIEELERAGVRQIEISRKYGIPTSTLRTWLNKYGKYYKARVIKRKYVGHIMMNNEKDQKILELESKLLDAEMKLEVYENLIELAKEEYQIDIKKNYSTDLLQKVEGKKDR